MIHCLLALRMFGRGGVERNIALQDEVRRHQMQRGVKPGDATPVLVSQSLDSLRQRNVLYVSVVMLFRLLAHRANTGCASNGAARWGFLPWWARTWKSKS